MEERKDIFDKIMSLPGLRIFEEFYKKNKEVLLYLFLRKKKSPVNYNHKLSKRRKVLSCIYQRITYHQVPVQL